MGGLVAVMIHSEGTGLFLCHHTLFNPAILMRCLLFPSLDLGVG